MDDEKYSKLFGIAVQCLQDIWEKSPEVADTLAVVSIMTIQALSATLMSGMEQEGVDGLLDQIKVDVRSRVKELREFDQQILLQAQQAEATQH